jgi:hypothetical protein
MCGRCGGYQHHPLKFCDRCHFHHPIHREKKMSWRNFLKINSHIGAGPINTICYNLTRNNEGIVTWDSKELAKLWKKYPERKKLYDEANKVNDKYEGIHEVRIEYGMAYLFKGGKAIECIKVA